MSDDSENFDDGFVGTSRKQLESMSDSALAQWQTDEAPGSPKYILADREWQRRMISHQLRVQYDLDSRLAKSAEEHSAKIAEADRSHAENLAKAGRRLTRWTSVVGIIGTILGAGLTALWQAKSDTPSSVPSIAVSCHCQDMYQQDPTSLNGAASSAVSSTSRRTKKTP